MLVFFSPGVFTNILIRCLCATTRAFTGRTAHPPIPYFYLAHALREYGFENIAPHNDKPQRLSQGWLPLLGPLCRWVEHRSLKRRRRKLRPLSDEIEALACGQQRIIAPCLDGASTLIWSPRGSVGQ